MFWASYIIISLFLSYSVSTFFGSKKKKVVMVFLLALFLTPAKLLTSEGVIVPALFSFLFNVLFEQEFSTRILRPILLTIPSSLFLLYFVSNLKKKFF